jgi:filamentous hemagglutinin
VRATTLDNSSGITQASRLSLNATNLVNHAGTITQTGTGAMTVAVSGTLDNSAAGTIQTNGMDLVLAPATLDNDNGTITHAGTGTLTLDAGNGAGILSNAGGTISSNGRVSASSGSPTRPHAAPGKRPFRRVMAMCCSCATSSKVWNR